MVKNPPASAGDARDSCPIPGSGSSPERQVAAGKGRGHTSTHRARRDVER